ncbi:MAG TPA: phage holin family protein [Acidimicrobiales bacterium]|nr:phage holin family protein [Acidimicrobiales bacterium]
MTDPQGPAPQPSDGRTAAAGAAEEKPVAELLTDMTSDITTLLRKEVEMAVAELKGEARQAAKAGGLLSGGALSGYLSLLFGSLGLAWLLDRKLPRPLAFFVVAGLHGAAAGALLARGRQEMLRVDPVPEQTIETLRENVEWAKAEVG